MEFFMSYSDAEVALDDNVQRLDTSDHHDAVIFNLNQALRFAIQAIANDLRRIEQRLDRLESLVQSN